MIVCMRHAVLVSCFVELNSKSDCVFFIKSVDQLCQSIEVIARINEFKRGYTN